MALVYKFKSTDSGAPALSGQVDTLRALLQAILVDGYNTKSVTITRSGTTATVSSTGHGYVDRHVVQIAGANESEYNGDHEIAYVDANTFTYQVAGSPASPATGTITAKVAPAGWTQPFTGTNKGAFLQPAGSNGFYLRVDDSNAQNAQVRGYESMSDVDTGSNLFPTNAQIAVGSGPYLYKSTAANSTARAWKAWSDKRSLILVINTDGSNLWTPFQFGDFRDFKAGGVGNTHCMANFTASLTSGGNMGGQTIFPGYTSSPGCYVARDHGGSAGAVPVSKLVSYLITGQTSAQIIGVQGTGVTYPAPIQGGLIMDKVKLISAVADGARGEVRGLFAPGHTRPLTPGDTFSGAAGTPYAGKLFEVTQMGANGQAFIQLNDWGDDG